MSLTSGKGPLSKTRAGRFTAPVPDGVAYVEPFRRRVRAVLDGRTVVDSERALLVHRPGGAPLWAFPPDDVEGVSTQEVPEAPGHVEVPWGAADTWFQEQDEVRLHAPNPYHRVEYVRSNRHLRVTAGDEVLVDTADTLAVYETALEPKLYVGRDAVRMDLLLPSDTVTHCPYKGDTVYFSTQDIKDVAWSYEDPLPEAAAMRGLISFEDKHVDVVNNIPAPAPLPANG
jgi:uncharacterized protein (DUF427 family)